MVIPDNWALEYKFDDNFIADHSIFGGFGICIGMQGSSQWNAQKRKSSSWLSMGGLRVDDTVELTSTHANGGHRLSMLRYEH